MTELRRACFSGDWLYVAGFFSLCFIGFIFYFVASCMDPGFAEISGEKSIMVTFEVSSLGVFRYQSRAILQSSGSLDECRNSDE